MSLINPVNLLTTFSDENCTMPLLQEHTVCLSNGHLHVMAQKLVFVLTKRQAWPLVRMLRRGHTRAGSVIVGVVGYPNVGIGRSSLINSLKRSKGCAVAAQPGHTKEIKSVELERGLRIVIPLESDSMMILTTGSVLLRNVKVEDIEFKSAKLYKLPEFSPTLLALTLEFAIIPCSVASSRVALQMKEMVSGDFALKYRANGYGYQQQTCRPTKPWF
ncbi:hypothetical protein JOM56_004978 [Amanita muscaria]